MLKIKNNIKNLISDIYERQKQILINRRFIRELNFYGNTSNMARLKYEINILEREIIALQNELKMGFDDSNY